MNARHKLACSLVACVVMVGCKTAAEHHASLPQTQERKTTVGTVQREIRIGMDASEVARVLGSPNIVTKSDTGEAWVYDKFSTDTAYSTSRGGVGALVLGGGLVGDALIGGAVGASYGQSSGARSSTQRTLTVVIRFKNGKVRDFDYHSSRF